MGHVYPWLFSHASSSMSTSSSSPTYPTTQREHSVHPAHLQALSVDKLRHQESLRRKNVQSGGNLRTTTPTFSGARAKDINVSKEKRNEKSWHQHVLRATAAMRQTRRRLDCFRMCGGSRTGRGRKCAASPHHIDADPAVKSLGNSCATSLHLVWVSFVPLFTCAQTSPSQIYHFLPAWLSVCLRCRKLASIGIGEALQLPILTRDWDPTFLLSHHRESSCLPHFVSHHSVLLRKCPRLSSQHLQYFFQH